MPTRFKRYSKTDRHLDLADHNARAEALEALLTSLPADSIMEGGRILTRSRPRSSPAALLPVLVEQTGGANGTISTVATYTYSIYAITDTGLVTALDTGLTPLMPRRTIGLWLKAPDGSEGIARKDGADYILVACQEVEDVEECTA